MSQQLTDNAAALRLFLTEDIYLIKGEFPITTMPVSKPIKSNETDLNHDNQTVEAQPLRMVQEPLERISKDWNFKFIGKNQKKVLILVNDEANEVSTEEGREVLRKLVKAINLTGNDFAIVNYAQYIGASFEDFKAFFECTVLLSFGVDCQNLKIPQIDLHHLANHENTRILVTQKLDILDTANKKILWGSLQQLKS